MTVYLNSIAVPPTTEPGTFACLRATNWLSRSLLRNKWTLLLSLRPQVDLADI